MKAAFASSVLSVLLLLMLQNGSAYRLNVPRVLLPYHPKQPVRFRLEVSDPEGGCFSWRSTRPDIITVELDNPRNGHCSDRAYISAVSKHAEEQSAMVVAEDKASGMLLSCGVTVDVIDSISLETTTKILFADAAPAEMMVLAHNNDGDTFSSLGGIPFDWHLSGKGDRSLRIVPFDQSEYEAPPAIKELERRKKKGFVILVEGLITGTATLTVRLEDEEFSKIASNSIDLLVVTNLLLIPSEDLYIAVHSIVHYAVKMPSDDYYLQLGDHEVCQLDEKRSAIRALKLGRTEIVLQDRKLEEKSRQVVRPPSARIFVVEPDLLQFRIDESNNWFLQVGSKYSISVQIFDRNGNRMFITGDCVFDTTIPKDFLHEEFRSKNGTHFAVHAVKSGKTTLKSTFKGLQNSNELNAIIPSLSGEQTIQIYDRIVLRPSILAFPYAADRRYEYQMQAEGGSGNFFWSIKDPAIASVSEVNGLVRSGEKMGKTILQVKDHRNHRHTATAEVYLLSPSEIEFALGPVEAQLGDVLVLNLRLSGRLDENGPKIYFTDCRHVQFHSVVKENMIFTIDTKHSTSTVNDGSFCATIALRASAVGDTQLTVTTGRLKAAIDISAFPPLKVEVSNYALVMLGSSIAVHFEGGPRPWFLQPSTYFANLGESAEKKLMSVSQKKSAEFDVQCGNDRGLTKLTLTVGNSKSAKNQMPVTVSALFTICCSIPDRLALGTLRGTPDRTDLPPCPSSSQTVYFNEPTELGLVGYGQCSETEEKGKKFESIDSLLVDWKSENTKLLSLEPRKEVGSTEKLLAIGRPHGSTGTVTVSANSQKYRIPTTKKEHKLPTPLRADLALQLVDVAIAKPNSVVLLNHQSARALVTLTGGSGHFHFDADDAAIATFVPTKTGVELAATKPGRTKLNIRDLCISKVKLTIAVKVANIDRIEINGLDQVELNNEVTAHLAVLDADGASFAKSDVEIMQLVVSSGNDVAEVVRNDQLTYRIRGLKVGTYSFTASATTADGRIVKAKPHRVQVFAPLSLHPRTVTLIPESVFQLEILGGPQPLPHIAFTLNDTALADIAQNGMITAGTQLGYSTITAEIALPHGAAPVKDVVTLKVVSLTGVRIRIGSRLLEAGEFGWARLEGLVGDETPFSFGGAQHPLKVEWHIDATDVVAFRSPIGASVTETSTNRYAVSMVALSPGHATLTVRVKASTSSRGHFASPKGTKKIPELFIDQIPIVVDEALQLIQPTVPLPAIRMTTDAQLSMLTNRRAVDYLVPSEFAHLLSITDGNILRSGQSEGTGFIIMRQSVGYNQTSYQSVEISAVSSLVLSSTTEVLLESDQSSIPSLPLGIWVNVQVSFLDQRGRKFHATNTKLAYRPHRFDLTDIVPSADNRILSIHLKKPGETVLKVWDTSDSGISAFLRLPVADVVKPDRRILVVGDVLCMSTPVAPLTTGGRPAVWKSDSSALTLIDKDEGMAIATGPGQAMVTFGSPEMLNSTTYAKITIDFPDMIQFHSTPKFVTNLKGSVVPFPIRLMRTAIANDSSLNVHGCTAEQLTVIATSNKAQFDCRIAFDKSVGYAAVNLFSVKAVFHVLTGSYACLLEEQTFTAPDQDHPWSGEVDLLVTAIARFGTKTIETMHRLPFHPRFEVIEKELLLNNLQTHRATVSIAGSPQLASRLSVKPSHEHIVTVSGPLKMTEKPNLLQYTVQLNTRSAVMWHEYTGGLQLIFTDSLTGQVRRIPVNVKLYGDIPKAAFLAMDTAGFWGFWQVFFQQYQPLIVAAIAIAATTSLLFLGYRRNWFNIQNLPPTGPYMPSPTSAFTNDSPSPNFTRWRTLAGGNASPMSSSTRHSSPRTGSSSPSRLAIGATPAGEPFLWSVDSSQMSPNQSPVQSRSRLK